MSPKDYSSIAQDFAMFGEFEIAINGEWCRFFVRSSESIYLGSNLQVEVQMTGALIPQGEFRSANAGRTVARSGTYNIPCEITGCSIDCQNYRGVSTQRDITLDICFRYESHNYLHGEITDTIDDVPSELAHMIEVADNPKKKTFFDWLDLD